MKAVHKLVAGLAVAGLATAAIAARPDPTTVKVKGNGEGTSTSIGSVAGAPFGFDYTTGFEASEGFPLGYIPWGNNNIPPGCSQFVNCWGPTSAANRSLITPTISNVHPAGGTQHLRVTPDPATRTNIANFGLGVDARYPQSTATDNPPLRPISPNTVTVDMSISNPNGQDFRVQPQSNNQGFLATSALFFYSGAIYVLDDLCGGTLNFQPTGIFWDTTGGYQTYRVVMNPCEDTTVYTYAGAPLYSSCVPAGTTLEQFLVFGDNYPGSLIDIDNLVMEADDECPSVCGNGILEAPPEQCEVGVAECNPGHTCTDCQCNRICTLDAPCTLENGANGPFYGPFDAAFGGIFVYEAPAGVEAVSVELCGSTGADQRIFYWGSCSDPADPGSANDDCYNGYAGADPTASCYDQVVGPNYESCTCHNNPLAGDQCYLLQIRPPAGAGQIHIEVNKKTECFAVGGHLGACCDTNGADTGCTDNVTSANCSGADKVWTENGKCNEVTCACIPNCAGFTCGPDGCGGSCGTCGDGNACNGVETCDVNNCVPGTPLVCNDNNACNGVESCNPASGCTPGTPLACDDGLFCNGAETCAAASGCVAGTNPCADNTTCNEETDACDPNSIPTVSEWGLVVLTLMLLIGAKVYFGRRQAIA